MNNPPTTPEHAGWFRDVRRILDISQVTPGLPLPFISSDRASFYFTAITHADDAAEAIGTARTILAYALGVSFAPRFTQAGSTRHFILEAFLASGLRVSLVAKAEHIPPSREDAPEFAAVAA